MERLYYSSFSSLRLSLLCRLSSSSSSSSSPLFFRFFHCPCSPFSSVLCHDCVSCHLIPQYLGPPFVVCARMSTDESRTPLLMTALAVLILCARRERVTKMPDHSDVKPLFTFFPFLSFRLIADTFQPHFELHFDQINMIISVLLSGWQRHLFLFWLKVWRYFREILQRRLCIDSWSLCRSSHLVLYVSSIL